MRFCAKSPASFQTALRESEGAPAAWLQGPISDEECLSWLKLTSTPTRSSNGTPVPSSGGRHLCRLAVHVDAPQPPSNPSKDQKEQVLSLIYSGRWWGRERAAKDNNHLTPEWYDMPDTGLNAISLTLHITVGGQRCHDTYRWGIKSSEK